MQYKYIHRQEMVARVLKKIIRHHISQFYLNSQHIDGIRK